ncbi:MAG: hydrolase [Cytophagales bacterium]|nr:MAG: hydrolase [Cytophagales bacterium]TAF61724.1 MAG: hydrolase [Cytophagales bacterium]
MENRTNKYGKYGCACCGYYTITEIKETCPVCFWEEDFYQEEQIDDNGGPNLVSLRQSRENFLKFGAIEERFINDVRKPNNNEMKK